MGEQSGICDSPWLASPSKASGRPARRSPRGGLCVCVFTSHTECTTGGRGTYAGVYAMQHDSPDRQVQCAILYDTRLMMQMSSAGRCLVICAAFDLSATEHKLPDILRDLIRPWECWHIGENELVLIGVILPPRPVLFVHGAFLEGSPRYT